jgi:hypothetical protein
VSGTRDVRNRPVPAVDPADLKRVWATQNEIEALYPGARSMIAIGFCTNSCSPGADVRVIFLRISMLNQVHTLAPSDNRSTKSADGRVATEAAWLNGNNWEKEEINEAEREKEEKMKEKS